MAEVTDITGVRTQEHISGLVERVTFHRDLPGGR